MTKNSLKNCRNSSNRVRISFSGRIRVRVRFCEVEWVKLHIGLSATAATVATAKTESNSSSRG